MDNAADPVQGTAQIPAEVLVGRKLREIRSSRGLSLRALADRSGLNINTLSLIENGKSSPSVSTLQQLSVALSVPLSAFFENALVEKKVVYTPAHSRPLAEFGSTQMENLAQDLAGNVVQPYMVTLKPGMGSGERMIVHTGHEFVYCLEGVVLYKIEGVDYPLRTGDSLVFQAHLPHCWENSGQELARLLMVLYPADEHEEAGSRHVSLAHTEKEKTMKIATITEDGKIISQHFGRAPYYLVLTIEDGKVVNREMRDKIGHSHFPNQAHTEETQASGHGMDIASHNKHVSMAEVISDCEALLCGGMGMGAYESMRSLNIHPIVTDIRDIDTAVQAYIDGKLVNHTELLH